MSTITIETSNPDVESRLLAFLRDNGLTARIKPERSVSLQDFVGQMGDDWVALRAGAGAEDWDGSDDSQDSEWESCDV